MTASVPAATTGEAAACSDASAMAAPDSRATVAVVETLSGLDVPIAA